MTEAQFEAIASEEIFRLTNCARTGDYTTWCEQGDEQGWNVTQAERTDSEGNELAPLAELAERNNTASERSAANALPGAGLQYFDIGTHRENIAFYETDTTTTTELTQALAEDSAASFISEWMENEDDRKGLLNEAFIGLGTGVAIGSGNEISRDEIRVYGTQHFEFASPTHFMSEAQFKSIVSEEVFRLTNCARTGDYNTWCEQGDEQGWNITEDERTNAAGNKLSALTEVETLNNSAAFWSEILIATEGLALSGTEFFEDDDGLPPGVNLSSGSIGGKYQHEVLTQAFAENIAESFMWNWMLYSERARDNILRDDYTDLGTSTSIRFISEGELTLFYFAGAQHFEQIEPPSEIVTEAQFEAIVGEEVFRLTNCARTGDYNTWCEQGDEESWNITEDERTDAAGNKISALTEVVALNTSASERSVTSALASYFMFNERPNSENTAVYATGSTTPTELTRALAEDSAASFMSQWMANRTRYQDSRESLLDEIHIGLGIGVAVKFTGEGPLFGIRVFGTQHFEQIEPPSEFVTEAQFEAIVGEEVFRLTNCARTGDYNTWCEQGDEQGWNITEDERTNAAGNKLSALIEVDALNTSADAWSATMASTRNLRESGFGVENIAFDEEGPTTAAELRPASAEERAALLMQFMMRNQTYRENLLSDQNNRVGIGVALRFIPEGPYTLLNVYGTLHFS